MSLTSWNGRELIGSQEPRVWSAPSAPTSAGPEAARLAEVAGVELFPWQRFVLEHGLRQRADGRWAAMELLLLVPRQNGKGTCIEVIELYVLFVLRLNVIHTAHQMKTSRKAFQRLWALIERTPQLRRRVAGRRQTAEESVIVLVGGAQITFMARSGRSGRGLDDCDVLFLDEALFLDPKMVEATVPTMSTRPNPLIAYVSSGGLESSLLLRALRQRLLDGDPALAGFEWSIDPAVVDEPGFDPLDEVLLAQSNPSLGALIALEYIRGEFGAMTAAGTLQGFLRERHNVFDADPAAAKRVIPAGPWARRAADDELRRAALEYGMDERVAVAVAAAWPDAESCSVGVARRLRGRMVVQIVEHRAGSTWAVPRARGIALRHGVPVVVDPGGPAGHLIPAIEGGDDEEQVEVVQPTMREVGHASADLLAEVNGDEPTLVHFAQPELDAAAAAAGRRPLGDLWTWQRRGEVDISPLESVTLAAWAADDLTGVAPPLAVVGTGGEVAAGSLSHIGF